MIKSAILCLALTIYHESRGEPVSGQYAVAEVVVNRSQERNLSICEVVYEPNQFSWVKAHNSIPSNEVFNKSLQIADDVLNQGSVTNYSKGSNYFKQSRLANSKNNIKARIGGHIFY